jgi:hypothetical protein
MWLAPAQNLAQVPARVVAQVQSQDGTCFSHPVTGKSFQIPLLGSLDLFSGPQALLDLQSLVTSTGPNAEIAEARRELERERQKKHQCETMLVDREREAEKLEQELSALPPLEYFSELEGRLKEECMQRRRCQTELLDVRGRPRLFCILAPCSSPKDELALARESRNEVSVPSLWQSFDFDFILEPTTSTEHIGICEEVMPVLDSSLRRPSSYACVLLASSQPGGRYHRALIAKMMDHLFECIADGALDNRGGVGAATVSMAQMSSDCTELHNLLRDNARHAGLQRSTLDDASSSDLKVVSAQTSHEVMAIYDSVLSQRRGERGHLVFSICLQRSDASAREVACAARLTIVELGSLKIGHGDCSSELASISKKQLARVAQVAQVSIDRTCAAWTAGTRRTCSTTAAPLQAKTFIIASLSQHSSELQESLAILQLTAASQVLQERSAKTDDFGTRKQLAKLLQENQRLRAELAERGRGQPQVEGGAVENTDLPAAETDISSPAVRRASWSSIASAQSLQDCDRESCFPSLAAAAASASAQRSCVKAKDGCSSEGRRRTSIPRGGA